tara:strand:- start:768 stop:1517 length:750 start_codon:yes stop_codon:yes gene_type:complete
MLAFFKIFLRLGGAVSLVAFWIGIIFLPADIEEIPKAIKKWESLMPVDREIALIWFSGILLLWVVWIDLRPLIRPFLRKYFAGLSRRVFDVRYVAKRQSHDEPKRIEIVCCIQFRRRIPDPLLCVRVTSPTNIKKAETKVVIQRRLGEVTPGKEEQIVLASLMMPYPGWKPRHSTWGEELNDGTLRPTDVPFGKGGDSVVEIFVERQVYRVFVRTPKANVEADREIFLLTEDEVPSLLLPQGTEQKTQP